ncbi:MAG: hypothetical protein WCV90_00615 [Candidatus Woesearchaeota archaeon]
MKKAVISFVLVSLLVLSMFASAESVTPSDSCTGVFGSLKCFIFGDATKRAAIGGEAWWDGSNVVGMAGTIPGCMEYTTLTKGSGPCVHSNTNVYWYDAGTTSYYPITGYDSAKGTIGYDKEKGFKYYDAATPTTVTVNEYNNKYAVLAQPKVETPITTYGNVNDQDPLNIDAIPQGGLSKYPPNSVIKSGGKYYRVVSVSQSGDSIKWEKLEVDTNGYFVGTGKEYTGWGYPSQLENVQAEIDAKKDQEVAAQVLPTPKYTKDDYLAPPAYNIPWNQEGAVAKVKIYDSCDSTMPQYQLCYGKDNRLYYHTVDNYWANVNVDGSGKMTSSDAFTEDGEPSTDWFDASKGSTRSQVTIVQAGLPIPTVVSQSTVTMTTTAGKPVTVSKDALQKKVNELKTSNPDIAAALQKVVDNPNAESDFTFTTDEYGELLYYRTSEPTQVQSLGKVDQLSFSASVSGAIGPKESRIHATSSPLKLSDPSTAPSETEYYYTEKDQLDDGIYSVYLNGKKVEGILYDPRTNEWVAADGYMIDSSSDVPVAIPIVPISEYEPHEDAYDQPAAFMVMPQWALNFDITTAEQTKISQLIKSERNPDGIDSATGTATLAALTSKIDEIKRQGYTVTSCDPVTLSCTLDTTTPQDNQNQVVLAVSTAGDEISVLTNDPSVKSGTVYVSDIVIQMNQQIVSLTSSVPAPTEQDIAIAKQKSQDSAIVKDEFTGEINYVVQGDTIVDKTGGEDVTYIWDSTSNAWKEKDGGLFGWWNSKITDPDKIKELTSLKYARDKADTEYQDLLLAKQKESQVAPDRPQSDLLATERLSVNIVGTIPISTSVKEGYEKYVSGTLNQEALDTLSKGNIYDMNSDLNSPFERLIPDDNGGFYIEWKADASGQKKYQHVVETVTAGEVGSLPPGTEVVSASTQGKGDITTAVLVKDLTSEDLRQLVGDGSQMGTYLEYANGGQASSYVSVAEQIRNSGQYNPKSGLPDKVQIGDVVYESFVNEQTGGTKEYCKGEGCSQKAKPKPAQVDKGEVITILVDGTTIIPSKTVDYIAPLPSLKDQLVSAQRDVETSKRFVDVNTGLEYEIVDDDTITDENGDRYVLTNGVWEQENWYWNTDVDGSLNQNFNEKVKTNTDAKQKYVQAAKAAVPAGTSLFITAVQGNTEDGYERVSSDGNLFFVKDNIVYRYDDNQQLIQVGTKDQLRIRITNPENLDVRQINALSTTPLEADVPKAVPITTTEIPTGFTHVADRGDHTDSSSYTFVKTDDDGNLIYQSGGDVFQEVLQVHIDPKTNKVVSFQKFSQSDSGLVPLVENPILITPENEADAPGIGSAFAASRSIAGSASAGTDTSGSNAALQQAASYPTEPTIATGLSGIPLSERTPGAYIYRTTESSITSIDGNPEDTSLDLTYTHSLNPSLKASEAVGSVVPDAVNNPNKYEVTIGGQKAVLKNGQYYPVGTTQFTDANRIKMTQDTKITVTLKQTVVPQTPSGDLAVQGDQATALPQAVQDVPKKGDIVGEVELADSTGTPYHYSCDGTSCSYTDANDLPISWSNLPDDIKTKWRADLITKGYEASSGLTTEQANAELATNYYGNFGMSLETAKELEVQSIVPGQVQVAIENFEDQGYTMKQVNGEVRVTSKDGTEYYYDPVTDAWVKDGFWFFNSELDSQNPEEAKMIETFSIVNKVDQSYRGVDGVKYEYSLNGKPVGLFEGKYRYIDSSQGVGILGAEVPQNLISQIKVAPEGNLAKISAVEIVPVAEVPADGTFSDLPTGNRLVTNPRTGMLVSGSIDAITKDQSIPAGAQQAILSKLKELGASESNLACSGQKCAVYKDSEQNQATIVGYDPATGQVYSTEVVRGEDQNLHPTAGTKQTIYQSVITAPKATPTQTITQTITEYSVSKAQEAALNNELLTPLSDAEIKTLRSTGKVVTSSGITISATEKGIAVDDGGIGQSFSLLTQSGKVEYYHSNPSLSDSQKAKLMGSGFVVNDGDMSIVLTAQDSASLERDGTLTKTISGTTLTFSHGVDGNVYITSSDNTQVALDREGQYSLPTSKTDVAIVKLGESIPKPAQPEIITKKVTVPATTVTPTSTVLLSPTQVASAQTYNQGSSSKLSTLKSLLDSNADAVTVLTANNIDVNKLKAGDPEEIAKFQKLIGLTGSQLDGKYGETSDGAATSTDWKGLAQKEEKKAAAQPAAPDGGGTLTLPDASARAPADAPAVADERTPFAGPFTSDGEKYVTSYENGKPEVFKIVKADPNCKEKCAEKKVKVDPVTAREVVNNADDPKARTTPTPIAREDIDAKCQGEHICAAQGYSTYIDDLKARCDPICPTPADQKALDEANTQYAWEVTQAVGGSIGQFASQLSKFGKYPGLSNLLFPETTKAWQKFADNEFLNGWSDITGRVSREICEYDQKKRSEIPGKSVAFIHTSTGAYQFVGSLQAEKLTYTTPIMCEKNTAENVTEEWTCPKGSVCVNSLCYSGSTVDEVDPDIQKPIEGYLYKITWGVTAPQDLAYTPYVDEDGIAIKFNLHLEGTDTKWIFKKEGTSPELVLELRNGANDGGTIIKNLEADYSRVCILFASGYRVKDDEGDYVDSICANFIPTSQGTVEYSANSASATSTVSSSAEVEMNI